MLSQKETLERAAHLEWAKKRALDLVDLGELTDAFSSFLSDLNKKPHLAGHLAGQVGMTLKLSGQLSTAAQMSDWISGTN